MSIFQTFKDWWHKNDNTPKLSSLSTEELKKEYTELYNLYTMNTSDYGLREDFRSQNIEHELWVRGIWIFKGASGLTFNLK